MRNIQVAFLVLLLILGGCTLFGSRHPTCEELKLFQSMIGTMTTEEELRRQMAERGYYFPEWIFIETGQDGTIKLLIVSGRTTMEDVFACLGQPIEYSAEYEWSVHANELSLVLLFSEAGMYAEGTKFLRTRPDYPSSIKEDFPLRNFFFMQPTSPEEMLFNIYGRQSQSKYEAELPKYKLWPGNIKDIEVFTGPEWQNMLDRRQPGQHLVPRRR